MDYHCFLFCPGLVYVSKCKENGVLNSNPPMKQITVAIIQMLWLALWLVIIARKNQSLTTIRAWQKLARYQNESVPSWHRSRVDLVTSVSWLSSRTLVAYRAQFSGRCQTQGSGNVTLDVVLFHVAFYCTRIARKCNFNHVCAAMCRLAGCHA